MDIRDVDHDDEETSVRRPWTGVDLAQAPSVQLGILLLLVLLALLVLWITWSLIT